MATTTKQQELVIQSLREGVEIYKHVVKKSVRWVNRETGDEVTRTVNVLLNRGIVKTVDTRNYGVNIVLV